MEEQATPQLAPSQLYDKRRSKDAARLRAYNKILEQIYNRIRVISQLPSSQCYLLYTVPPFILGLPKLDLEDCVVYLIYQLRHTGYEVRYTPPNMLYISWVHYEKTYLVEQSPIMTAMLESSERTKAELERKEREASRLIAPKKSQRKVRIETPGALQSISGPATASSAYGGAGFSARTSAAVNTVLNRPMSNPVAGPPPPSAADYVPPATFLQSVQNPKTDASYPKSVPEYFR